MSWDLPNVPSKEQIAGHSDLLTYLGVVGISLWGGLVNYLEKRHEEPFQWGRLFAHLTSSSFAGMMTFLCASYANVPGPLIGVLCGVAAHMGTPALIAIAMKLKIVREFLETPDLKDKKIK